MIKNIIVFTVHSVNDDYRKRYGVDFFLRNNIRVFFVNLSVLIYGANKISACGYQNNNHTSNEEIWVKTYIELYRLLKTFKNRTVIYLNITIEFRVLLLICWFRLPYIDGSLWGGIQTNNTKKKNLFDRLNAFILSPFSSVSKKINTVLLILLKRACKPFIRLTLDANDQNDCESNVLLNHSFDYDRFLINWKIPKPSCIPCGEYFLLLPNHAWNIHDYILSGNRSHITKEKYTKLINNALYRLEVKVGVRIVIAGYPNALREESVYEDRDFLIGCDTEQLVKYSSGVITHFSGAINFAILHNKPIFLINFSDFDSDKKFSSYINAYSRELSVPIYYVDKDSQIDAITISKMLYKDTDAYSSFIDKYICSNELCGIDSKISFWERILAKF